MKDGMMYAGTSFVSIDSEKSVRPGAATPPTSLRRGFTQLTRAPEVSDLLVTSSGQKRSIARQQQNQTNPSWPIILSSSDVLM